MYTRDYIKGVYLMTKKSIKLHLQDASKVLDMDYHDFLNYYNSSVFPIAHMNTDYYTIFLAQRQVAKSYISLILREL